MKTLILFRHGLAKKDLGEYGDQILTASLLPEGKPPIERMAKFLKEVGTDLNFVSPLPRCQQTAEIVQEVTGKAFTIDQRLSEYRAEMRDEPFVNFAQRCRSFFDEFQNQGSETV